MEEEEEEEEDEGMESVHSRKSLLPDALKE